MAGRRGPRDDEPVRHPPSPRSALADRLVTPWWYHPVSGGTLALLVASFATRRLSVVGLAAALWFTALYLLPKAYRRATGVQVTGQTPAEARRWARALAWTTTLGLLLGFVSSGSDALRPLGLVAAVVVLVLTQVLGRRFDDALREELRHDPEIGFKIEEIDTDA